jgi:diamine N-acetyltransferase
VASATKGSARTHGIARLKRRPALGIGFLRRHQRGTPNVSENHLFTQEASLAVELVEVTKDSVRAVCGLDAGDGGRQVAPNAVSIAQAYFHEEAWFRAIHANGELVGFLMLWDPSRVASSEDPRFIVWRFMIDARFQRRGHGRAALELAIAHVRSRGGYELYLSHVKTVDEAARLYRSLGFTYTGVEEDGELWMVRALR